MSTAPARFPGLAAVMPSSLVSAGLASATLLFAPVAPAAEHVHGPAAQGGRDQAAAGRAHATAEPSPGAGGTGLYTTADLQFLAHMIVHHEQALELCALVPDRTSRAELLRFVRYLDDAQRNEIDHMRGLLKLAADRGASIPETHLHGDPPMAGMLSRAQMARIAAARGAEFERLWLQGMIQHHEGAVDMALAQQEAQFNNRNQPWGVDTLVDEMLSVQRSEIARMKKWLAEWH